MEIMLAVAGQSPDGRIRGCDLVRLLRLGGVICDEGAFGDDFGDEEADAVGVPRGGRPLDPADDLDRRAFRNLLDDQPDPGELPGPLHFSADAPRRPG